eukprot:g81523.t1
MLYKQNSMGSIDMSNDDGDAGHVPFSNRRMIRYGSMSGGLSGGSTGSSGNHHHALGGEESIEHSEHSRPPSAARTTHINMEGLTHAYKSLRRDHRRGSTVGRVYSRAQSSRASSSNASSQANKGLPPAWLPYVPLFLGAGCVVLASATELVLRKTVTTHLYNYRWFFFELMAILTTLISLGGMMLQAWVKNQPLSFTQLPLKALLAMGFLDTLHSLGMTIGIGILPRTFSILLPQALIPLVVLLRSLKSCPDALPAAAASCSTPRVVGCGTVVLGLFVAAVPHFILFEPCVSEGRSAGEIGWNSVLVLLSLLPAALSSVYRSTLLATYQVDLFHMNACGAALQGMFQRSAGSVGAVSAVMTYLVSYLLHAVGRVSALCWLRLRCVCCHDISCIISLAAVGPVGRVLACCWLRWRCVVFQRSAGFVGAVSAVMTYLVSYLMQL